MTSLNAKQIRTSIYFINHTFVYCFYAHDLTICFVFNQCLVTFTNAHIPEIISDKATYFVLRLITSLIIFNMMFILDAAKIFENEWIGHLNLLLCYLCLMHDFFLSFKYVNNIKCVLFYTF